MAANRFDAQGRPTSVQIGPLIYSVRWWEGEEDKTRRDWGVVNTQRQSIAIASNLEPDNRACVFAHEVAHALLDQMNAGDSVTPEKAADMASYGMVMVWRSNPDVFRWWTSLFDGDGQSNGDPPTGVKRSRRA